MDAEKVLVSEGIGEKGAGFLVGKVSVVVACCEAAKTDIACAQPRNGILDF